MERKWVGKEVDLHRFWGKKKPRSSGVRRKLTRLLDFSETAGKI